MNGVKYSAYAAVGLGTIDLVCPTEVVRGENMECRARPSPTTASLEVTGWEFRVDNPSLASYGPITRKDNASDSVWAGILATSGTVRVKGKVDGQVVPDAEAKIAVKPRPGWAGRPVPDTVITDYSAADLHGEAPRSTWDLGHNHMTLVDKVKQDSTVNVLKSGPNEGIGYFLAMPFVVTDTIHVNFAALTRGSAFSELQLHTFEHAKPGQPCTVLDVEPFREPAKRHEGVEFERGSHSETLRRTLAKTDLGTRVEQGIDRVFGKGGESVMRNRAHMIIMDTWNNALLVADDSINGGSVRPIPYCAFNFGTP